MIIIILYLIGVLVGASYSTTTTSDQSIKNTFVTSAPNTQTLPVLPEVNDEDYIDDFVPTNRSGHDEFDWKLLKVQTAPNKLILIIFFIDILNFRH